MPPSDAIPVYLDRLTRALSFDARLARRVRQEVEDHLQEAITTEPASVGRDVEARAIARFGDPRLLAGQYAALSLFQQIRRVGAIVVLATAGVFVAMKGRAAWNGLMQWQASADFQAVITTGIMIDRYAFMLAFAIGIVGWAYVGSRRVSATFHAAYRDQLRRGLLLCATATAPLVASVVTDATLVTLRLVDSAMPAVGLVSLLSVLVEVGLAGILIVQLYQAARRAVFATSLITD